QAGESRLQEVLTGFVDPNAPDVIPSPAARDSAADNSDDDDVETEEDLGPDPAEAERRLQSIFRRHKRVLSDIDKHGASDKKVVKARERLAAEIMELKLTPKLFDQLANSLRETI